jgi:hypothetical protein
VLSGNALADEGELGGEVFPAMTPGPTIVSDKDDYQPGELVTLTGSGWKADEAVHLRVDDSDGNTWSYDADVVADASGAFTHAFTLPHWLVANYAVTATGASGATATTTFTDGQSVFQEGSGTWPGTCASPDDARTSDNNRAVCDHGENVVGSGFGLDAVGVPNTATNISFTVRIEGRADNSDNTDVWRVALSPDGGATYSTTLDSTDVSGSEGNLTVPPSLVSCASFGRTWTLNELTDANFRVRVSAIPDSPTGETMSIDDIDVRVCWDNYVITAASVAGGTRAVASSSASIPAALRVSHESAVGFFFQRRDDWRSTLYEVEGQGSTCADTTDFTNSGTDSTSIPGGITAPAARGTYDVTFTAYSGAFCDGPSSPPFTLTDGITVGVFGDSFGTTSTDSYTANGWLEDDGSDANCAVRTRTGVVDPPHPNAHLRLRRDDPNGSDRCNQWRPNISTTGLSDVRLEYRWGQEDEDRSVESTGSLVVQWKLSSATGWNTLATHTLTDNVDAPPVTAEVLSLPAAAANTSIDIRFQGVSSHDALRALVDDVIVTGDGAPSNAAPTVAADNASVTVDEGQTGDNTGTWSDPNAGDTVTLTASVGTVVQSGTNVGGTWSWSYGTTDGPDETQVVTITADDGTTSTDTTFQLNVNNVAPIATFSTLNATTVAEGATERTYGYAVNDPGGDTITGVVTACGSGGSKVAGSDVTPTTPGGTGSFRCVFDDGPANPQVSATATDSDGATGATAMQGVTVTNEPPTGTLGNDGPQDEGSPVAISFTAVFEPSAADAGSLRYAFDCAGGSLASVTYATAATSSSTSCTFDDNGSYTVIGVIIDKDGGRHDATTSVTVDNVAPTATFETNTRVAEGSPIELALIGTVDPSSADTAAGFEYAFDCGSGYGAFGASNEASCATDDNGTRTVSGKIRDKDGGVSEYTAEVTIDNVAPAATFNTPASIDEGSSINLSLTDVVDPGTADTHEFRFSCDGGAVWTDWGSSNGHGCPTNDNGTRSVTGQVRDDDGGMSAEYTASVLVNNVAPSATLDAPASVDEGDDVNLSLTGVVDPGSADTHAYRFSCDGGATWTDWGSSNSHTCPTNDNGSKAVKGQVRDDDGGVSDEYSASVTVDNVAPEATFNAPASVDEGSNINLSLTDASDPSSVDTAAGFEYRFSCDDGASWTDLSSDDTASCPTNDNGTNDVKGQIRDKDDGVSTYSYAVTVNNVAPTATVDAPSSVTEGSGIELSLTSPNDPSSADTEAGFHYAFDCGDGAGYGAWSPSNSRSCPTSDNGTRTVKGKITDKDGGVSEYTAQVTVDNANPVVDVTQPNENTAPHALGTAVTVSATFTDAGASDTHTCLITWDDGTSSSGVVTEPSGSTPGSCTGSYAYAGAGVYTIAVTVTDDDGGSGSDTAQAVVYDPDAGFVTGGGWIMVAAGSYTPNPSVSGKGTFGFVSKYKNGASTPEGQTEFNLQVAGFRFHSETYKWLVVSGHKAQYTGTGRVNGVSGYDFRLTAYDGQINGGGGVDKFRLKITQNGVTIFDNRVTVASDDMDTADPQAIGGGSIVIHKDKS